MAIEDEINSLFKNYTWELVPLPEGKHNLLRGK